MTLINVSSYLFLMLATSVLVAEQQKLEGHKGGVRAISFSPDGTRLVSGSEDGTARIWDLRTGKHIALPGKEYDREVMLVDWMDKGRGIVTFAYRVEGDKLHVMMRWWDAKDGSLKKTTELKNAGRCAVSSDQQFLAVTGGRSEPSVIRVCELESGKELTLLKEHKEGVSTLCFSNDGRWLASASKDKTVIIWDLKTGNSVHVLKGHKNGASSLAFSKDDKELVTGGSGDHLIKVWSVEKGTELDSEKVRYSPTVTCLSFSPEGKLLAVGGAVHLQLFNAQRWVPLELVEGSSDGDISSIAFSPDGKSIATGTTAKTIKIWKLPE